MMKYLAVLFMVMLLVTFVTSETYGAYVTRDLYAYWSFDQSTISGKTVDDIAGDSDGTINGAPKIVPGKFGEAMQFDGDDDYLEITILEGFGSELGTFSTDFWLKTDTTPDWTTLFKTLTDGLSMAWAIDLNRTAKPAWAYAAGNTHFYMRDETGKALAAEIQTDIYDGSWHHIAWVVEDGESNTCKIYVDGEEQELIYAYEQTPIGHLDFQHPVYLGAANNRGNIERFCPVVVDEFRIYTGALTDKEILQNMDSGAAVESLNKLPALWGRLKAKE